MFNDLLNDGFVEDDSPIDKENINQFILYFGDEDFANLKQMCKDAMKKEFPDDFHNRNASDIILLIVKQYTNASETTNTQAKTNGTTGQ